MFKNIIYCTCCLSALLSGATMVENVVGMENEIKITQQTHSRLVMVSSTLNVRSVLSHEDLNLILKRLSFCARNIVQHKAELHLSCFIWPIEMFFSKHWATISVECKKNPDFLPQLKDIVNLLILAIKQAPKKRGIDLLLKISKFDISSDIGIAQLLEPSHNELFKNIGEFLTNEVEMVLM